MNNPTIQFLLQPSFPRISICPYYGAQFTLSALRAFKWYPRSAAAPFSETFQNRFPSKESLNIDEFCHMMPDGKKPGILKINIRNG
jgi:hypothetical protein